MRQDGRSGLLRDLPRAACDPTEAVQDTESEGVHARAAGIVAGRGGGVEVVGPLVLLRRRLPSRRQLLGAMHPRARATRRSGNGRTLMQDAGPLLWVGRRPSEAVVISAAGSARHARTNALHRSDGDGAAIVGQCEAGDVGFEIDPGRVDQKDAWVELRPNDTSVLLETGNERFPSPARSQRDRNRDIPSHGGGRRRRRDAEGEGAPVLIEEGRLGFVVVEMKRWQRHATIERDGDGSDPRGQSGRSDLDRVDGCDWVREGIRTGRV
jgi:hypothetical protein